jgi:uncharacterized protein YecT (DUF1311 family)
MPARIRLVLLAALGFAVTPGRAAIPGQPNPDDVKTIDACVSDARTGKADPDACIGRVSSECLKTASTTIAMEGCNNRELLVWKAALNRDFDRLMARLTDDNTKQTLRDAQRAFFVYDLKQCTFVRIAHEDAPTALVAAAQCNLTATARYDLWLIEQINTFGSP